MTCVARLLLVICAGVVTCASAAGSDPTGGQPGQPPSQVANKPARKVLVDDTVTDAQLKQILAKGYKPESQARGNEVYYCRRERSLGTRLETKICKTSAHILRDELQGKEVTTRVEQDGGNMRGR